MRIRSTKPEFWRSRRIASVSWDARLVLKGLESYVDDNGVGKDDLALIVTDVFPRDFTLEPSRVLKRVQVAIDELVRARLVHRYTVADTDLLFIVFWEQSQYINRPSKGRMPRPDGTTEYGESDIQVDDLSPQEDVLSPQPLNREQGTGEQVDRGTGQQVVRLTSDESDEFDRFWDAYDKKIGKGAAQRAWRKAIKSTDPERIISAAIKHADWHRRAGTEDRFIPHASTWLNEARWEDERADPRPITSRRQAETDDLFDAAMQRAVERERQAQ